MRSIDSVRVFCVTGMLAALVLWPQGASADVWPVSGSSDNMADTPTLVLGAVW